MGYEFESRGLFGGRLAVGCCGLKAMHINDNAKHYYLRSVMRLLETSRPFSSIRRIRLVKAVSFESFGLMEVFLMVLYSYSLKRSGMGFWRVITAERRLSKFSNGIILHR